MTNTMLARKPRKAAGAKTGRARSPNRSASLQDQAGNAPSKGLLAANLSDAMLRALLEAASEGVIIADEGGHITFTNRRAEEMFGYSAEELRGMTIESLMPARYRRGHVRLRKDYESAPAQRSMGSGRELLARAKEGAEFPVEIGLSAAETESGTVVMALVTDVTDHKKVEDALRLSTERLRMLREIDRAILAAKTPRSTATAALKWIRKVVAPCQRAGVILFKGAAPETELLDVHGWGKRPVPVGSAYPIHDIFGDPADLRAGKIYVVDDTRKLSKRTPIARTLAKEGLHSYFAVPLSVRGDLIGVLVLWSEQANAFAKDHMAIASQIAGQLAVAIRQGQLLEEVRSYASELEQRVAERTAELWEMNADLDSFAYSVSHDLRAPLRAMHGFGQALLDDYGETMDAMARDFTTRIVSASAHMDDLIQDLLEYSRLSRKEMSLAPVRVIDAVTAAQEQLGGLSGERKAVIAARDCDAFVLAHHQTLVQVLANLISNAIKFARPGTVSRVVVWCERRRRVIRICVKDNGIGILPEHQERIFRTFERLHGAGEYPGTGIGLAIVRKGVDRMGGNVGVSSEAGKGSLFWVELERTSGDT